MDHGGEEAVMRQVYHERKTSQQAYTGWEVQVTV
jgi:hypothetical protein